MSRLSNDVKMKVNYLNKCSLRKRNTKFLRTCKDIITQNSEKIKVGLILFTNPSARAGYDTRSIFKRSLTGFNSEFSFY